MRALHPHAVSTALLVGATAAGGLWTALGATFLARAESKRPGLVVPAMLALWAFALSLVMLFSAIGVFAQQVGALVAILSAAAVASFRTERPVLGIGAITATLALAMYFATGAWQLANRPPLGALILIMVAPLAVPALARLTRAGRPALIGAWLTLALLCFGAAGWAFALYRAAQQAAPAW